MATRAIKKKRDPGEGPLGGDWKATREQAPSVVRADQPTVARILAMFGLFLSCVGSLAVLWPTIGPSIGWNYLVPQGWGIFLLSVGMCILLFHAFTDKDVQFRRLYGLLGGL